MSDRDSLAFPPPPKAPPPERVPPKKQTWLSRVIALVMVVVTIGVFALMASIALPLLQVGAALDWKLPALPTEWPQPRTAYPREFKTRTFPPDFDQLYPDVSEAYREAMQVAYDYNELHHPSKAVLYDYLLSDEGGSHLPDAAQWTVETIAADWNNNALETAHDYHERSYSLAAIYTALTSDAHRFTPEEAQWALDALVRERELQ
ncbi:MAG: Ltp family lipoprotein [Bowdeniella nasicola]|nr:Ltp family lipoprotein [Bowdeniella nasicola]